jgi:predicted O-linked N-acetylglucosamine transferase (SPINDLY family)
LSLSDALQQALAHHQAGRLPQAEHLYRSILQAYPNQVNANHNLGVLAGQVGQPAAGLPHLKIALTAEPDNVQYVFSYAEALVKTGSAGEARVFLQAARERGVDAPSLQALRQAIEAGFSAPASGQAPPTQPEKKSGSLSLASVLAGSKSAAHKAKTAKKGAPIHKPRGTDKAARRHQDELAALFNARRYGELESRANALLEQYPHAGSVWHFLGLGLQMQGKEGLPVLQKAAELLPDDAEVRCNLATVLMAKGQRDEAIANYRRALTSNPGYIVGHFGLGNALMAAGMPEEAAASHRRALKINPNYVDAHVNLGNALMALGQLDEAVAHHRRALEIKPDCAEAHNSLGIELAELEQLDNAVASYRRALELKPNFGDAHFNLGSALARLGQLDDALTYFRRALEQQPNSLQYAARTQLLLPAVAESSASLAVWRDRYQKGIVALSDTPHKMEDAGKGFNAETFFLAYHNGNDRTVMESLSRCLRKAMPDLTVMSPHLPNWQLPSTRGQRIRVGFISEYWTGHTIAKLFHGFIHHLDRSKFEAVLIHSANAKQDGFSKQLEQLADRTTTLPARRAAQQQMLMDEKLDVLFYPDIGMSSQTYFLAYGRVAPVQVVSWGHPDTTGLDTMDYFVSAASIEPEDADEHYTERLIRLNRLPCFYKILMAPDLIPDRASFGLPVTGTLYGCPQTLIKVHPDFDDVLVAIAEGDLAGHIVLLEGKKPALVAQLKARWAKSAPLLLERVIFLPAMSLDGFMKMLQHMDVLLDPLHFGSGNTLYEAMVYGIPVVTWPGQFMRGRIVAGAYRQLGITDAPIAQRIEDYAELALALGRDPERRAALRSAMQEAAKRELFDDMQAVREFEKFLSAAVDAAACGEKLPKGWRPENQMEKTQQEVMHES